MVNISAASTMAEQKNEGLPVIGPSQVVKRGEGARGGWKWGMRGEEDRVMRRRDPGE